MIKIEREDLQIISRHSNLSEGSIDKILTEEVYNDKTAWNQFLKVFFISLGVGFTTAGIIFFFAYNWADLHKFIKIGLIEVLIVAMTLTVLFSKLNLDIKNIILTGTSVLVGVLIAVFGQVYQTGANAYDFFLGWTLFITLWVAVSNFAPLWLLYLVLINTTFILYWQQVAYDWSELFVFTALFVISALVLAGFLWGKKFFAKLKVPGWFTNVIALGCVTYATIGIVLGIFSQKEVSFVVLLVLTSLLYALGIKYGLKEKSGFFLAIIPFSIIVIISAWLVEISDDAGMFFFISLFIIASVTFVIRNLIKLQRKWIR